MNQGLRLCAVLIEAFREPAMLVGAELRVLAANAALKLLLPTTRVGEALTLSVRSPDILDVVDRVLSGGTATPTMWREAVPVERIFDIWISPVDFPDQERMVAVTFRDLTDARRLERTRTDFIANVSHELRTPLASLIGFIETLKGPARDDINARERFLSIMNEQAARMSRLIDDLLSLSRVEQHEHHRPRDQIDLVSVVTHTIDGMRLIAKQRGMKISIKGVSEIIVLGDRDELIRLVENLIGNAVKYGSTPNKDSLLDVSVDILNSTARLCVRDYGPGIAKEHLPRLTERFYRAGVGSSGGTGLGLALVKHIVARHRGRMTISSEPGEGASFEVTLPLA